MAVDIQRRLFTCAEYETMLAAGIPSEDDRVELIEGRRAPIPRHPQRPDTA